MAIKDKEKEKQIFLRPHAWDTLSEYKTQLDNALTCNKNVQWKIDEDKDIRLHTGTFKNKVYIHIRYWWKDRPTKMGVAMLQDDWDQLTPHLTRSAETNLGISVMKRMVQHKMRDAIHASCEGCINDWPSQTDHECLMERQVSAAAAIGKVVKDLHPKDFILFLAKEASKENIILETPHQTYKKVMLFHLDTIKEEVLAELD